MKASKRVLSLRAMLVPAILLALMLCLTTYVGAYDDWKDYGAPETGLTIYEDQVMIKNLGYNTVYGLKDSAGNIVLPAKYDRISYAGKNRLLVSTDNPFAFNRIVDLRGNLLYGDGSEHFEYYKGQNVFGVSKLGKEAQYLMDGNYKRLTKDYSAVRYLDEGYFLLKNWRRSECDDDVVCGVYRLGVGEIIPVKYRNIRFLKGSNDLLVVENSSYLRGLYDNNGKQVLPEAYSLLDSCSGDYIVAAKYRQPEYARPGNDKFEIENQAMINAFGLLDIDGNEIVPFQYDDIRFADGGNVELMIWDGNIETQYGLMGESKMVYSYDEEVASLAELLKNQPTLIDVPTNAWYSGAVHWAAEEGMIDATARYLRPNENATRGEVVEYLWKAAGKPRTSVENPFTDLTNSDSYYTAALWAYEKGITTGTSATTFSPKATCTRAQVVTFLFRAMNGHATEQQSKFTDVASTAYYADSVAWAVDRKITSGTTDTTFSPDATCTRAQILTFLYRAMT